MDNAKQHWPILRELDTDLANKVRSFMVIGEEKDGVIVVTKDGQGYWLGAMEFGWNDLKTANEPTPLDVPGIISMAQGDSHILLLNSRGEIYSMGQNDCGQLGVGTADEETRFSPQLISSRHKFTSVRCGGWHSLALAEDGKVWAWGANNRGQVGVHRSAFLSSPRQITEFDFHRIVAIECGSLHSLALTDQGKIYAWGWNERGQLGYGRPYSTHTPTRILTPSPVQSIAAGYWHTMLLTRTGEVYACGSNEYGQLGLPFTTRSSSSFVKIAGLPYISQIATHHATDKSIAMSSEQRCFVWGRLDNGTSFSTPRKLPPVYATVESPLIFPFCTPQSVTIPETPPSRLFARMSRMFKKPETSDVQFVVKQRKIHAHRIILSNLSDYFARMFSKRWLPKSIQKTQSSKGLSPTTPIKYSTLSFKPTVSKFTPTCFPSSSSWPASTSSPTCSI